MPNYDQKCDSLFCSQSLKNFQTLFCLLKCIYKIVVEKNISNISFFIIEINKNRFGKKFRKKIDEKVITLEIFCNKENEIAKKRSLTNISYKHSKLERKTVIIKQSSQTITATIRFFCLMIKN